MKKGNLYLTVAKKKGYIVDKDGKLISPKGKVVKCSISTGGYYKFNLSHDGEYGTIPVHRLQAYQKFGDKLFEEGMLVRHLNGNCIDNSFNNIEIGTSLDNSLDIPKNERIKNSEKGRKEAIKAAAKINRRFTDRQVKEIRSYYKKEKSYKKVMDKYKITSKGSLYYILNTESY